MLKGNDVPDHTLSPRRSSMKRTSHYDRFQGPQAYVRHGDQPYDGGLRGDQRSPGSRGHSLGSTSGSQWIGSQSISPRYVSLNEFDSSSEQTS